MSVWSEIDRLKAKWDAQRDALLAAIKNGGVFSAAGGTQFCLPNGKWKLVAKKSSLLSGAEELFDTYEACLRRAVECTKATLEKEAEQKTKQKREARA